MICSSPIYGRLLELRPDHGLTGSYSESEDTLRGVETSQSTCLCSREIGNLGTGTHFGGYGEHRFRRSNP
jgi:hypothetical protein